jgi:hypothetical protein
VNNGLISNQKQELRKIIHDIRPFFLHHLTKAGYFKKAMFRALEGWDGV